MIVQQVYGVSSADGQQPSNRLKPNRILECTTRERERPLEESKGCVFPKKIWAKRTEEMGIRWWTSTCVSSPTHYAQGQQQKSGRRRVARVQLLNGFWVTTPCRRPVQPADCFSTKPQTNRNWLSDPSVRYPTALEAWIFKSRYFT
ncbi:hypothetical protein VTI28DRAFT_2015 [Corynascus sepedonium]